MDLPETKLRREAAETIKTLGDLAEVFEVLKESGWAAASVNYVRDRVWWEGGAPDGQQ